MTQKPDGSAVHDDTVMRLLDARRSYSVRLRSLPP